MILNLVKKLENMFKAKWKNNCFVKKSVNIGVRPWIPFNS